MANNNRDFVDLSGTINTRTVQDNRSRENTRAGDRENAANGNIDPEVRELVVDETLNVQRALEERMRNMVQEEMSEMKKSILELSKVVKELSVSRSQVQESVDSGHNIQSVHNGLTTNNHLPLSNTGLRGESIRNNENITGSIDLVNERRRNSEKMTIRVDKWGIVFNGNNTHLNIEDFIFRIEHLQSHYDISWEEILRDFHLLVDGAARDWYWLLVKTHGTLRWPTLKNELRNQYRTNISNFEIIRDLVERKQQQNESIDTFFFEMSKLRSRLLQPIPEYDMIKIMKKNVRESVARIVYPISVSSVEQLRIECQEAERHFPRKEVRGNFSQQRMVKSVNEMAYENIDEEEPDLEEISAAQVVTQKQNITCWNCKLPGHGFRDCNASERSLFCYRCGKPNVIAPKCSDCLKGNRSRDVGVTGDLRPAKNPN